MSLVNNEDIAIIYGISKPFETLIRTLPKDELVKLWHREVDNFYYSKRNYMIILSTYDENIVSKSKNCYDKLKSLAKKDNIILKTCFEMKF